MKPLSSTVLTAYLLQRGKPYWTSYFIKYKDVVDDQRGLAYFNWSIEEVNYQILRTGCYPFIKYHCTRYPSVEDLRWQNQFFKTIKVLNFGLPCLLYGLAACLLIKHTELVRVPMEARGTSVNETRQCRLVPIYFLIRENTQSKF